LFPERRTVFFSRPMYRSYARVGRSNFQVKRLQIDGQAPSRSTVVCTINTRRSLSRGSGGPGKLMPTARTNIGSCVMAESAVQPHTHASASCTHTIIHPQASTCLCACIRDVHARAHVTARTHPTLAAVVTVYRCRTGNPYRTWSSIRSPGSPGRAA